MANGRTEQPEAGCGIGLATDTEVEEERKEVPVRERRKTGFLTGSKASHWCWKPLSSNGSGALPVLFGFKGGDLVFQPFQHGPGGVVVHDHTRMDMPGDGPLLVIVRGDFMAEAAVGGYDTFGVRRHLVAFEIEADFDFALWVDAPPYAVGILEAGFRVLSYS